MYDQILQKFVLFGKLLFISDRVLLLTFALEFVPDIFSEDPCQLHAELYEVILQKDHRAIASSIP